MQHRYREGGFQVSQKEEMLVWQNSADAYDCTKLILMNLNTGNTREITATGNNRMMPLGFMNEDLIYGVADMAILSGILRFYYISHVCCLYSE